MRRVLVVEDDVDTRDALAECLADSGFSVITASDGQAGLECLRVGDVDLVLLDLVMPGMDGQQFMAEMRRRPRHRDVPVLVTTAVVPATLRGADGTLEKPFDVEDLLEAIRRCFAEHNHSATAAASDQSSPGR